MHAAGALERGGWAADARELAERALAMPRPRPGVRTETAKLLARQGNVERAGTLLREVGAELADRPWERATIGQTLLELSIATGDARGVEDALSMIGGAADARPDSGVLRHDYAVALLIAQRPEDAAVELVRAAELADRNAEIAARAAQVLEALGRTEEAARWGAEAARRAGGGGAPQGP